MICEDCKKPQGVLRDDPTPLPEDDDFCWRHVNSHAPCADEEDLLHEVKRLRAALDAVMGACDPECYGCGAYYVAKKALGGVKEKP